MAGQILFIGAGAMGGAILRGALANRLVEPPSCICISKN